MKSCLIMLSAMCVLPVLNSPDAVPLSTDVSIVSEDTPDYPEEEAYVLTRLNIRSTPDGSICGQYKQGDRVSILGYEGDWAKTEKGYCWAGFLAEQYCGPYRIYYDSEDASRYVGDLYEEYTRVPDKMRELLQEYEITLCSNDIPPTSDAVEDRIVAGKTSVTAAGKKIRLYASSEFMKFSFLHELGHAVDFRNCMESEVVPSDTQAFSDILEEEKQVLKDEFLCDEQNLIGNEECFAEAFRLYIEDQETLKEKAPLLFDYIEKTVFAV